MIEKETGASGLVTLAPHVKNCFNNNLSLIPEDIKVLDQWLLWKYHKIDGRITKIPLSPSGQTTDATRSAWAYVECLQSLNQGIGEGLGISLRNGLCGLDLDTVLDGNGNCLDEEAKAKVEAIGSYTEITPSGKGLHSLFFFNPGLDYKSGVRRGNTELYFDKRFFTVTGNLWAESPSNTIKTVNDDVIKPIYDSLITKPKPKYTPKITSTASKNASCSLVDGVIIRRLLANRSSASLLRGDFRSYASQSEADLALANYLAFWTGRDIPQMDRIFRQSGLMRPKWDEPRGNLTYAQITLLTAVRDVQNVYGEVSNE